MELWKGLPGTQKQTGFRQLAAGGRGRAKRSLSVQLTVNSPLVILEHVTMAQYNEIVSIQLPNGEIRTGQVLEVSVSSSILNGEYLPIGPHYLYVKTAADDLGR